MTTPAPGKSSARAAGLLLLGIAAIALVLGVIALFGGSDDDGKQAGPPPSSTASPTPPPSGPASTPPATTSAKPPPATTTPPPSTPGSTTKPPPPANQPPSTHAQPVRIYNNSTIKGLGAQAAADFRKGGWNVVEVGNYSQGIIATATVYYRPGTGEEAAARELAAKYGMRVEPRFAGIKDASAGVIAIVTNDYTGRPGKG